jgi:ApbE superfamily uncharacterized protein (UPF0280 family)
VQLARSRTAIAIFMKYLCRFSRASRAAGGSPAAIAGVLASAAVPALLTHGRRLIIRSSGVPIVLRHV